MGCLNVKRQILINKADIIVGEKHNSNNSKEKLDPSLIDKYEKELRENYYQSLYDELALIKYLQFLKDNNLEEKFEKETFLNFDALSKQNKIKFTGVQDFPSTINLYLQIMKHLNICQRIKLKSLFSSFDIKNYFKIENNKFVIDIDKIEKERYINKITIRNPELYFNNLIQYIFRINTKI